MSLDSNLKYNEYLIQHHVLISTFVHKYVKHIHTRIKQKDFRNPSNTKVQKIVLTDKPLLT